VAKMSKRERAPAGKPMAQPPAPVPRAQEPAAIAAPSSLLRYGDLRMPPPSATTRGTLTPAARRDRYLDLAADPHTQHINVDAALDRAVHRAHALENKHVPDCELVWSDAFDHAYPADARIDIPSDGDFHSVPLCERAATCTPLYVTVPRESTDVFATADIDNPLDAPLLPGPVDVYLDGHFLLATRLDTTPARARFSLGLGVEQAIKVARNTRFSEESAGLMGGSLVLSHHLELDIRNNLGHPAPLEIRERIPVAEEKDDDVDVRVAKVSPAWEAWEQALDAPGEVPLRGGYRWRITVAAGELAKVFADYEIKISAKHQLAGGNRREA
ncbi:MAG TPA: DUF4139 domain-containing protein, partial [Kofleriaceae bacterium]|nr:DUF4139 domain-containing protein [Kofleriaceae bacterium]